MLGMLWYQLLVQLQAHSCCPDEYKFSMLLLHQTLACNKAEQGLEAFTPCKHSVQSSEWWLPCRPCECVAVPCLKAKHAENGGLQRFLLHLSMGLNVFVV